MTPKRLDRVTLVILALLITAEIVFAVIDAMDGDWQAALGSAFIAIAISTYAVMRPAWIKIGYRRGRAAFLTSMAEAAERGLTPHEWINAEMERDMIDFMPRRERRKIQP